MLGEDCDPIDPGECGFPFPSNVWRAADSKTPTGYHMYFGPTTLPQFAPGKHVNPVPFASKDGFSPGGSIMVFWPDVSVTGLPDPTTIAASTQKSSPTLLIDYETGDLVPHWDELDENSFTKDGQRAFFIRPPVRKKDATRYLVAIRGVLDSEGKPIAPSPAFKALRDGADSSEISVGKRRALYADILGKLKGYGVDTRALQMAWDFTTASVASTTGDMTAMRVMSLATVCSKGPSYTISQVVENPNPYIRRRLTGQMTVPIYLTNPPSCAQAALPPGCPGSSINRDASGKPAQSGTQAFPFMVQIPNSIVNTGTTGAIIQTAHGLFGDLTEGQDSNMAEICDREHYVEIAVNLERMASDDVNYITDAIAGDISTFQHVVDRLHQGFVNELLAMRMMMGGMATDPQTMPSGKPTIDTTQRYYRGDSQGGISGGVYMAISTDVTRGWMDNTGSPYDLLLPRSVDFAPFFLVIRGVYTDPAQLELGLDLIQQLWDNAEPDGYIPYISQNMLEGTPAHNVLISDALGDQQVSPLGAQFIARTVNATNLEAVNREVYGIPDGASGFSGNGYVEYNFWLPTDPITDIPPNAAQPDPHDALRQLDSVQDMADEFYRTGAPHQTCADGGPCAAPMGWSSAQLLTPASAIEAGTGPDAGTDGGGN